MRRGGLGVAYGMLALTLLGAGAIAPPPHPQASAARPVPGRASADVLHDYLAALLAQRRPKAVSFDYTVSQLGLHDMEQTHHVYRSGHDERDETVLVDGYTLKSPSVRILRNRTDRYDVVNVAPRANQYAFHYVGAMRGAGTYTYRFRTLARSARAFEAVEIDVDGRTLLPALIRFHIAGGHARGEGTLRYGLSNMHWVVREARVTAKLRDRTTARERIAWSNYHFYEALPQATFDVRKPAAPPPKPAPAPLIPGMR